jgi:tetratricopeptide (TPR) repeat protein
MSPVLKPGFSSHELKIIKRVSIFSVSICLVVVAGAWLYNSQKTGVGKKINLIKEQPTFNELDKQAHQLTAARYLQNGNPKKAIPHLQRILLYDKKDQLTQITLANAFLEAGEYQSAYDIYTRIKLENLPESTLSTICTKKGIALYYMGKKDESRQELNQCLTQYPQSAEGYCFLGQIEASADADSLKTLNLLEKAIQIDSNYVEAWYQLGRYWMTKDKLLKAREYLLNAIQIDPLHSKSHARLGMIYYYLGNSQLSRASYQTAIAINPSDFNTHYNLGELFYSRLNDTLNALKEFKKAIEEKPDHVEANFKIGLICMKNNMFKEAIHYFEKALTPEPSNTRILMQLAVAYERIGQKPLAITTYKRILAADELNSIAHQKLKLLDQKSGFQ